jgi:hypothetical protein
MLFEFSLGSHMALSVYPSTGWVYLTKKRGVSISKHLNSFGNCVFFIGALHVAKIINGSRKNKLFFICINII